MHGTVADKDGTEGEFKPYGHARPIEDPDERDRYGVALEEATGWRPPEGTFDLFAIDIDQVAMVGFGEPGALGVSDEAGAWVQVIRVWRPGAEVHEEVRPA